MVHYIDHSIDRCSKLYYYDSDYYTYMQAAMMEHRATECVNEMSINTEEEDAAPSTTHGEIETNKKHIRKDAGLVQLLTRDPGLSVKQIVEDDWQDIDEQHCARDASTPPVFDRVDVPADSVNLDDTLNIKEEMAEIDVYPTVLQHMDTHQPNLSVARQASEIYQDHNYHALTKRVKEETDGDMCGDLQPGNKETPPHQQAQSQLYGCDHCPEVFKYKASLNVHKKYKHSKESHKYAKQVITNADLQPGKEKRNPPQLQAQSQLYVCDECPKVFKSKTSYNVHKKYNHSSETSKCTQCNKEFKCEIYLCNHVCAAHSNQQHKCDFCEVICISEQTLTAHHRNCHGSRYEDVKQWKFLGAGVWRANAGKPAGLPRGRYRRFPQTKPAMMEHRASESVNKPPQMKMTIKGEVVVAATEHIDREEPWFVQSVINEPVLSVKEEILEDNNLDGNEQQCVQVTSAAAGTGRMNEPCSTSIGDLLTVKHEMEEMDIGPTVLQHMDIHYTVNKKMSAVVGDNTIIDDSNTAMTRKEGKKESIKDKLRDNNTISRKSQMKTDDEAYLKSCHGQYLLDTSSSSFKFDFCERTFCKPHSLNVNRKLHQWNKIKTSTTDFGLFVCHICDAKFGWKSHLEKHLHIHTGEKPFQCEKCDAKFTKSCHLTTHIKFHTGKKHYHCNTCDASFARSNSLTRHKRVHTGEKPYQCDTCDTRFADRSSFTRHTRAHTARSPTSVKCVMQALHKIVP